MAEETGGINYPIRVSGDFKELERFNTAAEKAVASLERIKQLTSSGIVGSGGPRNKGASSDQTAKQLSLVEQHTKKIAAAQRNLNTARDKEVRSKSQTLNVSKKIFDIENQIEQLTSKKTNNKKLASLQRQLAVYRRIEAIGKQQQVLASEEVKTLTKGLSIRRQHFSLDVRENDIANQKLQARKFEVAEMQKKLSLANRLKAAQSSDASRIAEVKAAEKLKDVQVQKNLLSREDLKNAQQSLSIQKARTAEDLKSAKLQDRKLQSKRRQNQIDEKLVSLDKQLAVLRNKDIQDLNTKLAAQKEALALQERAAAVQRRTADSDKRGEIVAQERINKALENEVAFRRQIQRARELAKSGRTNEQAVRLAGLTPSEVERMGISMTDLQKRTAQTVPWIQRLRRQLGSMKDTLERVTGASSGLFFTFRRLIGVLALFTIARQVTQELTNMAKAAINFNSQLEKVRLGVASVIIATGQVFSPVGEALTDAGEQLQFATSAASDQLDQLRIDALRTSATFEDLSEAFQTAIGPGLSAGLDLNNVREFAVQISQAATAIGVQQNQLAEEIRSILQGTIQIRTTRIAAVLGITNEDIRQAKELGRLSEFLDERFQSFSAAGRESLKNFDTIVTNLADAFKQLLGRGSLEFFEALKGLLTEIKDDIASVNEVTNQFDLNPDLVRLVKELSDGFQLAMENAASFREELTANDLLPTFEATAKIIEVLGGILGGLIQGTIKGLRDVSVLGSRVATAVAAMAGIDLGTLATDIVTIVEVAVRIGIAFAAAKLAVLAFTTALSLATVSLKVFTAVGTGITVLTGAWKAMVGYIVAVRTGLITVSTVMTVIRTKAIGISAAIGFWPLLIAAAVSGIIILWDYMDRIGGFVLAGGFITQIETLKLLFETTKIYIQQLIDKFMTAIRKATLNNFRVMFSLLGNINQAAKKQAESLAKEIDNIEGRYDKRKKQRLDELSKSQENYRQSLFDTFALIEKETKKGEEQPAIWERAANWVKEGYNNLVDFDDEADQVVTKADKLTSKLSELPSIIAASSNGFKDVAKTVTEMTDAVEGLEDKLSVGVATLGSSGGEDLEIARLQAEAAVKVRQRAKLLDKEIVQLRGQQESLAVREVRIQADINRLSESQNRDRLEAFEASQNFMDARLAVLRSENEVAKLGQGEQRQAAEELLQYNKQILEVHSNILEATQERIQREGNSEVLDLVLEEFEVKGRIRALTQIIEESESERAKIVDVSNRALALELQLRKQIIQQKTRDLIFPTKEIVFKKQIQAIDRSRFLTEEQKRQAIASLREREIISELKLRDAHMKTADRILDQKNSLQQQLDLSPDLEEAAKKRLQEEINRLEVLRQQNELLSSEADNRAANVREDGEQDRLNNSGPGTLGEEVFANLTTIEDQLGTHAENWADVVAAPFEGMHQGLMSGMQKYLTETGDAMDIIRGLGQGVMSQLTAALSKYVADWITQQVLMRTIGNKMSLLRKKEAVAEGAANAAAHAPGATMASIASFGTAVGIGLAAIAALSLAFAKGGFTLDAMKEKGFATGGHTKKERGFAVGGTDSPLPQKRRRKAKRRPGSVDPRDKLPAWFRLGEYIIRPEAVNMYGRGLLDAINEMRFDPMRFFGIPQMTGLAQAQFAMQGNAASMARETVAVRERGFATGGPTSIGSGGSNSVGALDAFDNEPMTLILVRDMTEAREAQERIAGPSRIQEMIDNSINDNNQ